MASRNVSGSDFAGSDDESESGPKLAGPSKPYVNYGDRMPFRQGKHSLKGKVCTSLDLEVTFRESDRLSFVVFKVLLLLLL